MQSHMHKVHVCKLFSCNLPPAHLAEDQDLLSAVVTV